MYRYDLTDSIRFTLFSLILPLKKLFLLIDLNTPLTKPIFCHPSRQTDSVKSQAFAAMLDFAAAAWYNQTDPIERSPVWKRD